MLHLEADMLKNPNPRWLVPLVGMLVAIAYLPSLRGDFVWDDTIFLRDLPAYRDPSLLLDALGRPFVLSPNYFRPFAILTFAADFRLWGMRPVGFQLKSSILRGGRSLT
jgi:hypothetical protein